jgi:hypothetical protein
MALTVPSVKWKDLLKKETNSDGTMEFSYSNDSYPDKDGKTIRCSGLGQWAWRYVQGDIWDSVLFGQTLAWLTEGTANFPNEIAFLTLRYVYSKREVDEWIRERKEIGDAIQNCIELLS